MKVAVLGSGGGALAVAADFARSKRETVLADLPQFAANLEPVSSRGGVVVKAGWHGDDLQSVAVADVASAVEGAGLVAVVVPCFGHEPFARILAPLVKDDQSMLFLGEGSGAIVAHRVFADAGKHHVVVGETNTLPYLARPVGPGTVTVDRKSGGILLAAIPRPAASGLVALIEDVWPYVTEAESVWETVLVNFNAIDHVATMLANAGTLENRSGGMLLWGEGATPSVVRVIEAVDEELLAIRAALGLADRRRYRDFLIAQEFAPEVGPDLYDVIRASKLVVSYAPTGSDALSSRYITEDVPYALVLASSIADATGVETPVLDGLIAIASAMLGKDFRADGRDLEGLGLGGLGTEELQKFAETGEVRDGSGQ
jgi:opine dehydrogenase